MSEDEHSEGVVVRRVIRARPERVFRSWTDPAELRRWWGPDGFTCPEATVDLRTGGTYRLVMQPPGDGPLMSVTGTYQRIDPPSLLVYTWRWDSGPAASGRRVDADIEITEMIPDQRIEFRTVKGPVRPHGSYDLRPADDGTEITFRLSAHLDGVKRLMAPIVSRTMRNEVAALAELKQVLESG